jgi:CubicO group peptidase (beta-lactamase class C family)
VTDPTHPTGNQPPHDVVDAADALFAPDAAHGLSLALVVQHRGAVVLERYGAQPDTIFGPGGAVDAESTLISWSMAKSITHALVGIAAADGLLDVDAPAPVPEWAGTDKARITLLDLLEMRSGLEFVEDYVDERTSNCIEMLYGAGKEDMAAYAAALPLQHAPGSAWNYSSGTTNIISRIVGQAVAPGATSADEARAAMEQFINERLFMPIGMTSAIAKFDPAGTFIGSSYVFATARDFAKFGELYLRDGIAPDDTRILPPGWVEHARTYAASDDDGFDYGRHWWLWPDLPGVFGCHGYEGQYTIVAPDRELVVVHLGKSPVEQRPALLDRIRSIIRVFEPD